MIDIGKITDIIGVTADNVDEFIADAIKKHIPTNVIYEMFDDAYCPKCGRNIDYLLQVNECKYCCNCGQALKCGDDE